LLDAVDSWLDSDDGGKVFFLTGGPGVGKTTVSAMLCHKNPAAAAFHLCSAGDDTKSDPLK